MLDFCSHDKYYIVSDRVADACGACNLGRNLRGSPHFFLYRDKGDKMGKIFLTYEEQLNKLINENIKIINVTSLTAKYSRLDLNDLGLEKVKNRNSLYAKSKLCIEIKLDISNWYTSILELGNSLINISLNFKGSLSIINSALSVFNFAW